MPGSWARSSFCLLLRPKAGHVDLLGLWGSWGKAVALPSRTAFFLASAPGRRHESTEAPHQWPSSSKLGSWLAGRPPPLYRHLDILIYMVAGYEGRSRVLAGSVISAAKHYLLFDAYHSPDTPAPLFRPAFESLDNWTEAEVVQQFFPDQDRKLREGK